MQEEVLSLLSDVEESIPGKETIWTFVPGDLAPEEIVCPNVLESCRNGRENAELLALYGEEVPEYLYYAEFDMNGDERLDYVVVHTLTHSASAAGALYDGAGPPV